MRHCFAARIVAFMAATAVAHGHASAQSAPPLWRQVATVASWDTPDVSFVDGSTGYAVFSDSYVTKTTNGGTTWTPVLSLPVGYQLNTVQALNTRDVVVGGWIQSTSTRGFVRWSHDGGATWSDDLAIGDQDNSRLQDLHFWDTSLGFGVTHFYGSVYRTTAGGALPTDWTAFAPGGSSGWFGGQASALPDGHVRLAGSAFCTSLDHAATWACRPPIDAQGDSVTFFTDDQFGWVGGGFVLSPSPPSGPVAEGWVHRTTDGGSTWSARILDVPLEINAIVFLNRRDGWAAGDGVFGGIYATHDGGDTWTLEFQETDVQPYVCTAAEYRVYCMVMGPMATSIYVRDFDTILRATFD